METQKASDVSPRIKMLSVVAILGLGLGLAMFFPRRTDLGEHDNPGDALPLRESAANDQATGAGTDAQATGASAAAAPLRTHQPLRPAWASSGPTAGRAGSGASIVSSDDSAPEPAPSGMTPSTRTARRPSSTGQSQHLRTHTIVDGDTLAGIAQRYLGRMDRATEIYELNRQRLGLESPDLLPIGAVLHIPSQADVPAARSSPPTSQAALRLVPIPEGTFSRPSAGAP